MDGQARLSEGHKMANDKAWLLTPQVSSYVLRYPGPISLRAGTT